MRIAYYILAAALALPVGARAQTYLNQLSVAAPALTDVIPFTQGYVGKGTGVTRNMTVGGLLSTPGSTQYVPFSGGTLSGPLNLPQGGTLTNPTIAGTFSPTTTNLNGAVSGVVGASFNGSDVTTAGNRMVVRYPYAMIARDAGAGTTAVSVGTPSTLTQGTTGTIATPSADATNGCINLTWTAPNSDSWKVVARIHDVETGN